MNVSRIKMNAPILNVLDLSIEQEFGVTIEELQSKDRTRFISQCRALYTNFAHQLVGCLTMKELGALVNRSHCNIIWQIKKQPDWLVFDKEYKSMYERLQNKFNELKNKQGNGMV